MSQLNLLEIVPDQLFQTHFIADIDNVQKNLQYEIERKREELRAMVGERYRELIHAADTIEQMKDTTASTLNHISEMISSCKNLHDTHLVGFKIDEKPSQTRSSQPYVDPMQSITVQVKLLMEIPEKIWVCIEEEDFIKATQLFIMARHINTGLQLQIGGKTPKPGYESLQRLVSQQWTSTGNFSQTIVEVCRERLRDIDISVEVACSCLISLFLLDSQPMGELLNILIALHSNSSLKTTLQFELAKLLEGDVRCKIKEKVVSGVRIVIRTVELIYSCFVENNGGAVLAKLKELYSKDSPSLIEMVNFSDQDALKLLPSVIANFRISTNKQIEPLDKAEISKCVVKWNEWVQSYIDEQTTALLQNVTRVKLLHEIREDAFKVEIPPNWSTICASLSIPEVHVWCHYYQPILTRRVKQIIDNRWTKIYDNFKTQLLIDLTKESEVEKECDLNWFVWNDLIGDTVIESRNDVVKVMNSLMKGMWLQDRGYTPTLEKLCETLDSDLHRFLEDLKFYLYSEKKRDKLYSYDVDTEDTIYADKSEIEAYLRDVSDENVHSMLQYIKACFEEQTLQSTEIQKKTTAIYTARFTQSINNLIPSLHKCYVCDNVLADKDDIKRWDDLCDLLKENYLYCWGKWVDIAMEKIMSLTEGLPQEFTLEANVDYLMMQWDTIKIEEKDDEENAIESSIKVPAGPSLKLQEFLYSSSRIFDEIVPHTLPAEIHTSFVEQLASISLEHYNKVIREKGTDINQRCALQLLMDVRHLTLLLVPRENKRGMELSQDICECLRQKIDPFDYDVFYPHIQNNLKRSVQRVQTLFGSLILNHGQLTGIIGNKPAPSAGAAANPALLAGSNDTRNWFSLLPVAAHLAKRNVEQQQKKKPTASPGKSRSEISDLMSSSLPLNFASARSGAAQFFNSMTSDWFSST